MNDVLLPDPPVVEPSPAADPAANQFFEIKNLPKEVGAMLLTAGIVGFILPGPGTPAIIAGGIVLWPNAFGKVESWFAGRYPFAHKKSMEQISRFLIDLEKRYPDSTKPRSPA